MDGPLRHSVSRIWESYCESGRHPREVVSGRSFFREGLWPGGVLSELIEKTPKGPPVRALKVKHSIRSFVREGFCQRADCQGGVCPG